LLLKIPANVTKVTIADNMGLLYMGSRRRSPSLVHGFFAGLRNRAKGLQSNYLEKVIYIIAKYRFFRPYRGCLRSAETRIILALRLQEGGNH
jgi:hypothetical protein